MLQIHAKMNYLEIRNAYRDSYKYEKTQNYTDAIKVIKIVSIHYADTYTVNLRLGHLYLMAKKYANSMAHYKKAAKALPEALSPLLGQMSVEIAKRNYSTAETKGFNIIKNDLYNYYGNLKLSYVLMMQGKYDSSQKIIFKMLSKYPEDTSFLVQSAQVYTKKKSYALAIEVYRNVLVLDPENVQAKYYLSKYAKRIKK